MIITYESHNKTDRTDKVQYAIIIITKLGLDHYNNIRVSDALIDSL